MMKGIMNKLYKDLFSVMTYLYLANELNTGLPYISVGV